MRKAIPGKLMSETEPASTLTNELCFVGTNSARAIHMQATIQDSIILERGFIYVATAVGGTQQPL